MTTGIGIGVPAGSVVTGVGCPGSCSVIRSLMALQLPRNPQIKMIAETGAILAHGLLRLEVTWRSLALGID